MSTNAAWELLDTPTKTLPRSLTRGRADMRRADRCSRAWPRRAALYPRFAAEGSRVCLFPIAMTRARAIRALAIAAALLGWLGATPAAGGFPGSVEAANRALGDAAYHCSVRAGGGNVGLFWDTGFKLQSGTYESPPTTDRSASEERAGLVPESTVLGDLWGDHQADAVVLTFDSGSGTGANYSINVFRNISDDPKCTRGEFVFSLPTSSMSSLRTTLPGIRAVALHERSSVDFGFARGRSRRRNEYRMVLKCGFAHPTGPWINVRAPRGKR